MRPEIKGWISSYTISLSFFESVCGRVIVSCYGRRGPIGCIAITTLTCRFYIHFLYTWAMFINHNALLNFTTYQLNSNLTWKWAFIALIRHGLIIIDHQRSCEICRSVFLVRKRLNFHTRDTCRCELQLNTKLGIMYNINLLEECLPLLEVIKAAFLVFAVYWGSVIELTDDDYLTRSGNRTLVTFRHEWDFHPLLLWDGRILLKRAHFLFFQVHLRQFFTFPTLNLPVFFAFFL